MNAGVQLAGQLARGSRKIRDLQDRIDAAQQLAFAAGVQVQLWMLWEHWARHVGCSHCHAKGERALCWGRAACHGYHDGCGCVQCAHRDEATAAELVS